MGAAIVRGDVIGAAYVVGAIIGCAIGAEIVVGAAIGAANVVGAAIGCVIIGAAVKLPSPMLMAGCATGVPNPPNAGCATGVPKLQKPPKPPTRLMSLGERCKHTTRLE